MSPAVERADVVEGSATVKIWRLAAETDDVIAALGLVGFVEVAVDAAGVAAGYENTAAAAAVMTATLIAIENALSAFLALGLQSPHDDHGPDLQTWGLISFVDSVSTTLGVKSSR